MTPGVEEAVLPTADNFLFLIIPPEATNNTTVHVHTIHYYNPLLVDIIIWFDYISEQEGSGGSMMLYRKLVFHYSTVGCF